jgi:hypothetical protein
MNGNLGYGFLNFPNPALASLFASAAQHVSFGGNSQKQFTVRPACFKGAPGKMNPNKNVGSNSGHHSAMKQPKTGRYGARRAK